MQKWNGCTIAFTRTLESTQQTCERSKTERGLAARNVSYILSLKKDVVMDKDDVFRTRHNVLQSGTHNDHENELISLVHKGLRRT